MKIHCKIIIIFPSCGRAPTLKCFGMWLNLSVSFKWFKHHVKKWCTKMRHFRDEVEMLIVICVKAWKRYDLNFVYSNHLRWIKIWSLKENILFGKLLISRKKIRTSSKYIVEGVAVVLEKEWQIMCQGPMSRIHYNVKYFGKILKNILFTHSHIFASGKTDLFTFSILWKEIGFS